MRILISGGSGLVGTALQKSLATHEVVCLVRSKKQKGIFWDPEKQIIDLNKLENFDVVINLSGKTIAPFGVSKKEILRSRVNTTRFLVNSLSKLKNRPKKLISASAVGYYGTEKRSVDETAHRGKSVLADVCDAWEKEASQFQGSVYVTRLGVILSKNGGALKPLTRLTKLWLGTIMGSGDQWFPWVSIDDVVRAITFLCEKEEENKNSFVALNVTSPGIVTNRQFTKQLAQKMNHFAFLRLPKWCFFFMGSLAQELFLADVKAVPKKLLSLAFTFKHENLSDALNSVLSE